MTPALLTTYLLLFALAVQRRRWVLAAYVGLVAIPYNGLGIEPPLWALALAHVSVAWAVCWGAMLPGMERWHVLELGALRGMALAVLVFLLGPGEIVVHQDEYLIKTCSSMAASGIGWSCAGYLFKHKGTGIAWRALWVGIYFLADWSANALYKAHPYRPGYGITLRGVVDQVHLGVLLLVLVSLAYGALRRYRQWTPEEC